MAAWSLERTMRLLAVMEKSSRLPRQFGGLAEMDQVLIDLPLGLVADLQRRR
jgi:hypothetical protein